jgi:PEP-CTERM motif
VEAGNSRLIGGIHFPSDNIQGLLTGEMIGDEVAANAFTPVPEPPSLAAFAAGLILLLRRRRCRRCSEGGTKSAPS